MKSGLGNVVRFDKTGDLIRLKSFGKAKIVSSSSPTEIVLFISSDAGWRHGTIDLEKALAAKGAPVPVLTLHHWKSSPKSLTDPQLLRHEQAK
jgi:hypothetical protein